MYEREILPSRNVLLLPNYLNYLRHYQYRLQCGSKINLPLTVLDQHIHLETTLAMAHKMDRMNAAGFFNYFGSITVKNNVKAFMNIADIFREEVLRIQDTSGLQVYVVYNLLSVSTIEKMARRGGNALGIKTSDGPLTSKSITVCVAFGLVSNQLKLSTSTYIGERTKISKECNVSCGVCYAVSEERHVHQVCSILTCS